MKSITKNSILIAGLIGAMNLEGQNNFKIGIFSSYNGYATFYPSNTHDSIVTSPTYLGNNSSILNVLKADGFDLIEDYIPDPYITYSLYEDYVQLCQNNGFQLIDQPVAFYKPDVNLNQYDNVCNSQYVPFYDFDRLYNHPSISHANLYAQYPTVFYGHNIGSEKYCNHPYPIFNDCGNTFLNCQVTPQRSSDAIAHFKSLRDQYALGQKIINSEAAHGGWIENGYINPYTAPGDSVQPQDYIHYKPYIVNPTNADVFNEASYPSSIWNHWQTSYPSNSSWNYLGKAGSIDYAHQNGYNDVIAEFDVTMSNNNGQACSTCDLARFNLNSSIQNGNLFRFNSYLSIIHKAHSQVFYVYGDIYDSLSLLDRTNKNYVTAFPANSNPFTFDKTPIHYQKYVSQFARELRYLVSNGYLSDDDTRILYQKTNSADVNGIVPAASTYIPATFAAADARDYNLSRHGYDNAWSTNQNVPSAISASPACCRDEMHGLQYIIRTNGSEAVMIVTNGSPFSIHNVTLNFNSITNPQIANAKFVDVLFENGYYTNVNSLTYKADQTPAVSQQSFTLNKGYVIPFCNKTITADFGPLDTHVYHFRTTGNSLVNQPNGWQQVWTNNGNGIIGSWGTQIFADDQFIPFDFDGNGDEELLCVQNSNTNAWFSVLDYRLISSTWQWSPTPLYTNNGGGTIFNGSLQSIWQLQAGDRFIPGDFDGDGKKNELLCIQSKNTTAKVAILKVDRAGMFYLYWSNAGMGTFSNTSTAGWNVRIADKFQVGDFDGDGKLNDVLCIEGDGPWWGIEHFSTSVNNFTWGPVQGTGYLSSASIWTLGANDEYYADDYNGDGIVNDLLCINRGSGKVSQLYLSSGNWIQRWTNGGNGYVDSWGPISATDAILTGDIDANDTKAEMMFIQRCASCSNAVTEDFDASNLPVTHWNAYYVPAGSMSYINTWAIGDAYASNIRYLFIKPIATEKKYLLAFKNYGCNNSLINMYKSDPSTNKSQQPVIEESPIHQAGNKIALYPNPTTGFYTISSEQALSNTVVEMFDLMGKSVYKKQFGTLQKEEIDISSLHPGIYYVRISNAEGLNESHKIIKQ